MKKIWALLLLLGAQSFAEHWALRSPDDRYLVERNGKPELAPEFNLKNKAFFWSFQKQDDGAVLLCNAASGKIRGPWAVETTHGYERRVLKDSDGNPVELAGVHEWMFEPIPEPVDVKGRGAKITWTEYQAEEADIKGRVAGPATGFSDPAAEAVGRMAVYLEETGDFLAWTVKEPADGLSVRYSMPDAPQGGGIEATLSLYVNGKKRQALPLTSKHIRVYGTAHRGARLWNDDPNNGDSCVKFFDTARFILDAPVKAGDRIELRKDAGDDAAFYLIDLIELEKVPTIGKKPEAYLSITDFGAVAGDGKDDSSALFQTLEKAKKSGVPGVWIPVGVFDFDSPVPVKAGMRQDEYQRFVLHDIHLQGAGMWHTVLRGQGLAFQCDGNRIRVSDMAFDWGAVQRGGTAILFFGRVGEDSEFWNLYATRSGLLLSIFDDTSRNLKLHDIRLRETFMGGINLRGGHQNALMENVHVRGTGDDGLIFWSPGEGDNPPTRNCTIRNCTVETPWLANCFIMAGGEGCLLEKCVARDGVRHCGVRVTSQIYITPTQAFSGNTHIRDVSFIRCGSEKPDLYNGALQLEAHGHGVTGIRVENCDIYSAPYVAVQAYTKIDSKSAGGKIVEAEFKDVRIHGAALYGVHMPDRTPGTITLKNFLFDGVLMDDVKNDSREMNVVVEDE